MRNMRSLEQMLSENLPCAPGAHQVRRAFVVALLTVKGVNLVELACAFAAQAK